MWTCPKCRRDFRHANQNHTCNLVSKEDIFGKRAAFIKDLYNKVIAVIEPLGEFREEAVLPDVIFLKSKSTFLAVKVKKDHLDIEFFLDHLEDDPVVSKWLRASRNRVAHVVPIDNAEDITTQLKSWIKSSYQLISSA